MGRRKLAVLCNPEDSYEFGSILLARTVSGGPLELLTAAWERLLGYGRRELDGKTLCELMAADRDADGLIASSVAAIFDEQSMASVELTLRCRSGARKLLRLHRRLDTATGTVHIVGEEISMRSSAPAARRGAPANRRSAGP